MVHRAHSRSSAAPLRATCSSSRREKAKPISEDGRFPAGNLCSRCGLCESSLVTYVGQACAFIGEGMQKTETLEESVHGRSRTYSSHELRWGVAHEQLIARNAIPLGSAIGNQRKQWTGIVSAIACAMLHHGIVEGVVCITSRSAADPLLPEPTIATTPEEVMASAGVKPVLAPTARVLDEAETRGFTSLLYIGVGCSVQAVRAVQSSLSFSHLYVLGLHCADNGTADGLRKFIDTCSKEPQSVVAYEFFQDYEVHFKHRNSDGKLWYEKIPYFSLPASQLGDVIAPACKTCADYTNALADISVGYMGAAPNPNVPMHQHPQTITVRNERGMQMLDLVRNHLEEASPEWHDGIIPKQELVEQTLLGDEAAVQQGRQSSLPVWLGKALAWILVHLGPRGMRFADYSIDYHVLRNYIFSIRTMGYARALEHMPPFVHRIVNEYNGLLSRLLSADEKTNDTTSEQYMRK